MTQIPLMVPGFFSSANVLQKNFQSSPFHIICVRDSVIYSKAQIDFTYLRPPYSLCPPFKFTVFLWI